MDYGNISSNVVVASWENDSGNLTELVITRKSLIIT